MAMYLVSDEELNMIIRLRRRDVTRLIIDLHEQYPTASIAELTAAADQYFAQQAVAYDYLADYAAEEIAYSVPEPAAEIAAEPTEDTVEPLVEDATGGAEPADEPATVEPPVNIEVVDDTGTPNFDEVLAGEQAQPDIIESVDPEPQNLDPLTDIESDQTTVHVVDDTVQVVDDTAGLAETDPAALEIVPTIPDESDAPDASSETPGTAVAAREERANRISLRALQREMKQIDKV